MNTTLKTLTFAAIMATSIGASGVSASAQKVLNVGPAPTPGNGAPPSQVVSGCPYGYIASVRVDAYGNQLIYCVLPRQGKPVLPVGSIIGGIIGGIIAGHR